MNKLLSTALVLALSLSGLFAESKNSTVVYTIKGDASKAYSVMMDKPIKALGYRLPDPRSGVHKVYEKEYGSTTLDLLNFMTIVNGEKMLPLLSIEPKLAGFNPFNLVAYKHKHKDETVIAHLSTTAMMEMLEITDTKVIAQYTKMMDALDALIAKTFPKAVVSHNTYEGGFDKPLMHFELTFDRPEDLDDYIEEIQEQIESTFKKKGYVMAGFFDYKMADDGDLAAYDAFWTFSLCHFPYSYAIFDNEGAMPEASVFAPCTMYLYIKKDTNTLVLGMPRLSNWNTLFPMKDKNV
ncbi:MAG: hypothetical protein Q9M36_04070 [Sulfurovum sp.]|nr:hypothetical protein [Sulfurovum sp.]